MFQVLEQCFFVMKGRLDGYLKHKNGDVLVVIHQDGSDFELISLVSSSTLASVFLYHGLEDESNKRERERESIVT